MLVLIKGTGDIASAVACALHRAGYRVVLVDSPAPAEARRGMAFTEAVYTGQAELDGVRAVRLAGPGDVAQTSPEIIPVLVSDAQDIVAALHPAVVVDARMRKQEAPEPQIHEAPLVVGLGPGVRVGVTAHLAIETNRGPHEGAVLTSGETEPNTGRITPAHLPPGVPTRHAYAPATGVWETALGLGDPIAAGVVLGKVGEAAVHAPVAGTLRGITRSGAAVTAGSRVADVDPWRTPERARGITQHARTIAAGVLRALQEHSPAVSGEGA